MYTIKHTDTCMHIHAYIHEDTGKITEKQYIMSIVVISGRQDHNRFFSFVSLLFYIFKLPH